MTRPTKATIDLSALQQNAQRLRDRAPNSRCLFVVKADAYGHGIELVAPALQNLGDGFAVAHCDEGVALRHLGIEQPILILEGNFDANELALAYHHNLTVALTNSTQIADYLATATAQRPAIWLKLDTGMHRLGLTATEIDDFAARTHQSQSTVLFTHFSDADQSDERTELQLQSLINLGSSLGYPMSAANSPALLRYPATHLDWVRPGYAVYGNPPTGTDAPDLQPVMTVQSRIHSLRTIAAGECVGYGSTWCANRESVIATIPIGYADGYPRSARNGTPVLINGRIAELAGRVSMDLITVDVTNIGPVMVGDPVELWGKNLPVSVIADYNDLSGYEILARIPKRLPRIAVDL
jgi:alanine racemase